MGERGAKILRENDHALMKMARDPSFLVAPAGMLEPDPATMSIYYLEIAIGPGGLTEAAAQVAAKDWKRIAGRGVPVCPVVAGYDEDGRATWEIPELRAFYARWVQLAGISPETARRDMSPVGVNVLLLAGAFGGEGAA